MDMYKNVTQTPDQFAADCKLSDTGIVTGGTPSVMPGYSIADQRLEVLHDGSATDSDLDIDKYDNMTLDSITM